jgi:hypothetical protein
MGHEVANAVHEAKTEQEQRAPSLEQPARALHPDLEPWKTRDDSFAVQAPGKERQLIPRQAARESSEHHARQVQVPLVSGKPGHDQDRLALQEGAEDHGDIAIPVEQLRQGHRAGVLAQTSYGV